MMGNLFLIAVLLAGCLGVKGDGTTLLQKSMEQLVNHTAHEALDYLNLQKIGINVGNTAYKNYKVKLG